MRLHTGMVLAGLIQLALASSSEGGEIVRVTITDLAFLPAEVHVHQGDIVQWINTDFVDHSATEVAGQWDVALPASKSGQHTFTRAGTYTYFCRMHPGMTGTVHVIAK